MAEQVGVAEMNDFYFLLLLIHAAPGVALDSGFDEILLVERNRGSIRALNFSAYLI